MEFKFLGDLNVTWQPAFLKDFFRIWLSPGIRGNDVCILSWVILNRCIYHKIIPKFLRIGVARGSAVGANAPPFSKSALFQK